jgi:hypothetical protein
MLAKQCDVTVYKGMQTKIAKTVFEHEVKMLEAIYGDGTAEKYSRRELVMPEGKKYQVEGDVIRYEVEEIDYHEEYDRLSSIYGMHPEIRLTWVEYVYGPRHDNTLEQEAFAKYTSEFGKGAYAAPSNKKDRAEAEGDGLESLTGNELKALLKSKNVDYTPMANKRILLNLARKAGLDGITTKENIGGIATGVA